MPQKLLPEISPRIVKAYFRKTHKTLVRDVNLLAEWDLIELTDRGWRAKKEVMLRFKPLASQS